jgi:hypothetical protein
MYKEHASFIQPEDESIRVWRYMDFTKFVSLIDTRRLFFTRADKFDDPFEGSWPKINVAARDSVPDVIPTEGSEAFLRAMRKMGEMNKHWPRYTAINCWHMNEHESAAMWRLYLKSDEGIAIQSTYAKLKISMIDDEEIFLGIVKYIDYEKEFIVDSGNILSAFVHKRKSYAHEHEVRALVLKWPIVDGGFDFTKEMIEYGVQVKVDIDELVERIYIAPSAPSWFVELVNAVIVKYGYSFTVVHSKLNESPVF